MKRIVTSMLGAGLLSAMVGCGSAGVEEGMPKGQVKAAPLPSDMTNPAGKFGAAAAAKAAAKKEGDSGAPAPAPAPGGEAEKK